MCKFILIELVIINKEINYWAINKFIDIILWNRIGKLAVEMLVKYTQNSKILAMNHRIVVIVIVNTKKISLNYKKLIVILIWFSSSTVRITTEKMIWISYFWWILKTYRITRNTLKDIITN